MFDYSATIQLNKEEISDATTLLIQSYNLLTVYYNTMIKAVMEADKTSGTEAQKEERAIETLDNLEAVGSITKTLAELQDMTKKVVALSLDGCFIGDVRL